MKFYPYEKGGGGGGWKTFQPCLRQGGGGGSFFTRELEVLAMLKGGTNSFILF